MKTILLAVAFVAMALPAFAFPAAPYAISKPASKVQLVQQRTCNTECWNNAVGQRECVTRCY